MDEQTFETLRRRAFHERRSLAGIVREILRAHVMPPAGRIRHGGTPFSFVGSGRSHGKGAGTIAERHDEEFIRAVRK